MHFLCRHIKSQIFHFHFIFRLFATLRLNQLVEMMKYWIQEAQVEKYNWLFHIDKGEEWGQVIMFVSRPHRGKKEFKYVNWKLINFYLGACSRTICCFLLMVAIWPFWDGPPYQNYLAIFGLFWMSWMGWIKYLNLLCSHLKILLFRSSRSQISTLSWLVWL